MNIVEPDKPLMSTRIVQADSGSDTDSENRRQSAQSVVQADSGSDTDSENRRQSAQSVAQADSGSDSDSESWRQSAHRMSFVGGAIQTVWVRRLTGMISSFLFRLSESESEPESACTIRVPLDRTATGIGNQKKQSA